MSQVMINRLSAMKTEVDALMSRLDIIGKNAQMEKLEAISAMSEFWNDRENAQKTMQEISKLRSQVAPWKALISRIHDALELSEVSDEDFIDDLTAEVDAITKEVEKMSLQAMFTHPYDSENAILAIHAGAGGTDSQDWAMMLERMYLRWTEQNGYKVDILERSDGEEAGIKSVMMSVQGLYAYGYLRSEQGVHRLVRLSPFDAANRRHTSFVKVELWPDIQTDINIEINEKDLRIDTYRASGAGGQNVQKNDTAVRITHLPTGLVVTCQNQRSQMQNRERALQILKARLFEMERLKQESQLATLKGENMNAEWGNQIRSYVLHPYQLVKDHRTDYEVGNSQAVLDGRLNDFMESYLRYQIERMNTLQN
ncbi:MAG: peptide chain release factor 2 [Phototrophicales bacterium]|nr:peptide chain release factor 2 [Phototrophicales bacterium]